MAVSGQRRAKLNSTVLQSLLKLRLFCNNGGSNKEIQTEPTGLPSDADEALSYLQQNEEAVCAYCSGPIYSIDNSRDTDGGVWMTSCSHLLCRGCVPQHHANNQQCPLCASANSEEFSVFQQYDNSIPSSNSSQMAGVVLSGREEINHSRRQQYPSKLLAFLEDIQKQRAHKRYQLLRLALKSLCQ